jgi:hypothetical protein
LTTPPAQLAATSRKIADCYSFSSYFLWRINIDATIKFKHNFTLRDAGDKPTGLPPAFIIYN